MLFVYVCGALALLTVIVVVFRDRLEQLAPGWKTKVLHGLLALGGFAVTIVDYLQTVNFAAFGLTVERAALATFAVGVLGLLISYITKRKDF